MDHNTKRQCGTTSVALCGMVVSLFCFFDEKSNGHFPEIFAGNNFYCSIVYRQLLPQAIFISQKYTQPHLVFVGAGFAASSFCSLYWLIDIKRCGAGRTSSNRLHPILY